MPLPLLKGLGIQSIAPTIPVISPPSGLIDTGGIGKTANSTQMVADTNTPNIEPVQIATDIIHGIARSGGAIGLELTRTPMLPEPPIGSIDKMVKDIIFGPETLKSLSTRIAEGEQTAQKLGIPTKGPLGTNPALLASAAFVGGTVALDFSGVGGEIGLGEKLLKETSVEGASKLLSKIGVGKELLPKYSKLFAEAKTPEEISSHLQSLVQETKAASSLQPLAQEAQKYKSAEARTVLESGGISKEKTDNIIQKLQGVISKSSPDIEKDIRFIADTANPSTRKAFEAMTGVKLGNTQKGAQQQIRDFLGTEAPAKKWLTVGEAKKNIQDNIGKEVVIDDNKRDWIGGREPRTSNPSLVKLVGIEDNRVIYTRGGYEYSKHIDTVRDIIIDGKSQIGDVGNEKYASSLFPKTKSQLTDFYNQATKGISETTSKEAGMATKELGQTIPKILGTEALQPSEHITPPISEISALPTKVASIGEEVKGAIDRLVEAISSAKPARGALEKAYTAERSKRAGAVAGIFEQAGGQKGYFQALGKLKGALTPAEKKAFELGSPMIEKDINSLFRAAQINPSLDVFEKLNTQTALTKILSGIMPTNSELSLLEKTFGSKMVEAILKQRTTGQKILDGLKQLVNLPRSIMSSFDMSAPFRQGLLLISHPKAFGSSFLTMFRQFGSEEAFKAVQESIAQMPEYKLMKQGKLALTDIGTLLTNREEKFMSSWAEKIPLIKYPIKASSRAYVGFLNKLRADVFTDIIKGARAGGRELDEKLIEGIADFVNTASGRGSRLFGTPIGNAGQVLNGIFFSPRLMASRITMLNPVEYITADPIVRKEMFKSLFTVLGSGLTVLGLAKMAGTKVGDNSNSSDFGKIIIGNTRIDIWGGFQQYVRMASQLISGKYVSSTTGKEITLGEGYKPLTRFDIALRQVESKEAPVLSFITALLKQQDFSGKPVNVPKEIAARFIPMVIGDMYDLAKDNPDLLPASLLSIFGIGLQTFKPTTFGSSAKSFGGMKSYPLKQTGGGTKSLKGIGL